IELNYLNLVVEETFFRMLRHREFDVAEMSLSSYTISLFGEDPPFIASPVFPSRSFRHSCIYVNADGGIREPKDLIGKRIGNPEYQMPRPSGFEAFSAMSMVFLSQARPIFKAERKNQAAPKSSR